MRLLGAQSMPNNRDHDNEEYRMLVGLLTQQHVRYNDFSRICLTGNTILLGFVGLMLSREKPADLPRVTLVIPLVGIGICIVWILTLCRLRQDVKQLMQQLLIHEADMDRDGIALRGHWYMYDHKPLGSDRLTKRGIDPLEFPASKWSPARFRAHWMAHCFAWMFILCYGAVVFYWVRLFLK